MRVSDRHHLAAIMRIELLEAATLRRLIAHFGSAEALFRAPASALTEIGMSARTANKLRTKIAKASAEKEATELEKHGVRIVGFDDPEYPSLLKEIPDAPAALFVRGEIACLAAPLALAVVGTRGMTPYGETATKMIVEPLSAAGVPIVSGLAIGIDAVAHSAAVRAGGPTAAVLGSGVDRGSVGPRANAALAERIIYEGGCLISEYPPGVSGAAHRFPLRNRIVAGLTRGTIVIEAPLHSGALITARAALDYNRDVFVVPGPITQKMSQGSNSLLIDGAVPVMSAETVPGHYGLTLKPGCDSLAGFVPSEAAQKIIVCIEKGAATFEAIAIRSGLDAGEALAAISELELAGKIVGNGSGHALKN